MNEDPAPVVFAHGVPCVVISREIVVLAGFVPRRRHEETLIGGQGHITVVIVIKWYRRTRGVASVFELWGVDVNGNPRKELGGNMRTRWQLSSRRAMKM